MVSNKGKNEKKNKGVFKIKFQKIVVNIRSSIAGIPWD